MYWIAVKQFNLIGVVARNSGLRVDIHNHITGRFYKDKGLPQRRFFTLNKGISILDYRYIYTASSQSKERGNQYQKLDSLYFNFTRPVRSGDTHILSEFVDIVFLLKNIITSCAIL